MNSREISFYETDSGRCPVAEFIEEIGRATDRARVMKVFEAIQRETELPATIFKKMKGRGEIWEIRSNQYRFLGFHTRLGGIGPLQFVLVHSFQKKSQKTPLNDIAVALKRRDLYLSRTGDPQ